MTALRTSGLCPRLLSLRWLVLLVLAVMVCAQSVWAGSVVEAIEWLWRTPPDGARVELRVISVDAAGERQFAEVALQYRCHENESYAMVTITAKDHPTRVFCLHCDAVDGLSPCEVQAGSFPGLRDEFVPGTLVPWSAMLIGFCRQFRAVKLEALSDMRRDVVELQPEEPNGVVPAFKLRIFVSKATQLPEEVVHLDGLGREQANVEIQESRKTKWGRVVTRSIYRELRAGNRVLIEVRGGNVMQPHEREERSPTITHGDPAARRYQP